MHMYSKGIGKIHSKLLTGTQWFYLAGTSMGRLRTGEDLFSPVFLCTCESYKPLNRQWWGARACAHTHGTGVIRSLINGGMNSLLWNSLYLSSLLHPYTGLVIRLLPHKWKYFFWSCPRQVCLGGLGNWDGVKRLRSCFFTIRTTRRRVVIIMVTPAAVMSYRFLMARPCAKSFD